MTIPTPLWFGSVVSVHVNNSGLGRATRGDAIKPLAADVVNKRQCNPATCVDDGNSRTRSYAVFLVTYV